MSATFRCAAASLDRDEDLAGSASTARGYLLLECSGPWGEDALRHNRLPAETIGPVRARAAALGLRMLLIRRPGRPAPTAGTAVYAGYAAGARSWLEGTRLDAVGDLTAVDLEGLAQGRTAGLPRSEDDLFLVCTHGRHDVCCAERGRPVAAALAERFPEQTWEVSHIGGDRFAANLLVLPEGLYYGRLDAASAVEVAHAAAGGDLVLDHLRGRSGLAMAVRSPNRPAPRLDLRDDAVHRLSRTVDGSCDGRGSSAPRGTRRP